MGRRKHPSNSSDSSNSLASKGKYIIVLGIVMTVIGFVGAIYYGSQFVKEEVDGGARLPYTTPLQINNLSPMDLEIVFVVIAIIGFGLLIYEFAGRVDKSHDFYPKWMNEWLFFIMRLKANNPWWYLNEGTILKLKTEIVKQNVQKNFNSRRWDWHQYCITWDMRIKWLYSGFVW